MGYQNFFATKLYTDIGASDTTITLDQAPTETSGRLVLEARNPTQREIIKYTGVSGNQITGVSRGQGGTTAKSHVKGSLVEMNATAEDFSEALGLPNNLVTRFDETLPDYVASGLVWTQLTGLNGTMTLGVVYINGNRVSVSAVATNAFPASKDVYVDVDVSGTIVYTPVANGATSGFTLAANSLRLAKVVTNGSAITSITQSGVDVYGNVFMPQAPGYLRDIKYYTTVGANTWTKPAGLRFIEVEVIGGGGGGGGNAATNASQHGVGAGGGGGGYAKKRIFASALGATETATVGAGGTVGAGANGGGGGTSSFGSHCSATGGAGGLQTVQGSTGGIYLVGGSGGGGTGGDININGKNGGITMTVNTSINVASGGFGGDSPMGFGYGGNATSANSGGAAGKNYGGGGSGSASSVSNGAQAGGVGAQGIVIVKEYF